MAFPLEEIIKNPLEGKKCCSCGTQITIENTTKGNLLYSIFKCKKCSSERRKSWSSRIAKLAQSRSNGLECTITIKKVKEQAEKQNYKCFWFGIDLDFSENYKDNPFSPSPDRLDSNKGYVDGNWVLTSKFVNLGRNSLTTDQFLDSSNKLFKNFIKLYSSLTGNELKEVDLPVPKFPSEKYIQQEFNF